MARAIAQMKMGYYKTPETLYRAIFSRIHPAKPHSPKRYNLLDPCCGKGAALAALKEYIGKDKCITFGIEAEVDRARRSKKVLNHVLVGDAFGSVVSTGGYSLLFLNPPYDYDGDSQTTGERLEGKFLKRFMDTLTKGGILVFLIPQNMLVYKKFSDIIAYRFERVQVFRFPDNENAFRQIVLYGVKKREYARNSELAETLKEMGGLSYESLPVVQEITEPVYSLPDSSSRIIFRHNDPPWEEIEQEVRQMDVIGEVFSSIYREYKVRTPVTPLRRAHLLALLAAGGINTVLEKGGKRYLIKGKTEKEEVAEKTPDETIRREVIRTKIFCLSEDGVLTEVT